MASGVGFKLIVRRGPQPNQVFELTKDVITIGRDITNDIVISDPEVSRHHMRLTRVGSGYTIEDLGSTNGVMINQRKIAAATPVSSGDLLSVGETVELAYEAVGGSAQQARTVVGDSTPPPPPPPPAAAGPMPGTSPSAAEPEADAKPLVSRNILIGCGALAVLALCAVVLVGVSFFIPWCDFAATRDIAILCVPLP